jgi:hypothetical protein
MTIHKDLYQIAYNCLSKSTPLRTDCGRLCNRACCGDIHPDGTGGDALGMYLFPGEEVMLREASFLNIEPVRFTLNNHRKILLATCQGECNREYRPLACRIFPLIPYLTAKDILTVKIDPRAAPICPLAVNLDRAKLHPDFVENVRKACHMLINDPEIKEYIADLSKIIDEYFKLTGLFKTLDRG